MQKIMIGCGILLAIFGLILLGVWFNFARFDHWYDQFQADLPGIKKKMTELNNATLSQISPPAGVTEIVHEDRGPNRVHYGTITHIEYRIDGSELNIMEYYRKLLTQAGWTRYAESERDLSYYYDDACIQITIFKENQHLYWIEVFHDFQKQAFSPKLPPDWYVGFREFGETWIATCPWQ